MTAKEIIALLSQKHKDDVFVPECKDGPTQCTTHFRMDAWAMNKSWAHPQISGYEVKVSRSDFLGDKKWDNYLSYCNLFYFVAPKGLIKVAELHEGVGLMEVASNGKSLRTIHKAKYREVDIPDSLWRYILMCRSTIGAEIDPLRTKETQIDYWRRWMELELDASNLGQKVSFKLAQHVNSVERENRRLKQAITKYDDHKAQLKEIGIDPEGGWGSDLTKRVEEAKGNIQPWAKNAFTQARDSLARLEDMFK